MSSLFFFFSLLSLITPQSTPFIPTFLDYNCTITNTNLLSATFISNRSSLFSSLSSTATIPNGFQYSSSGAGSSDAVYGNFLCRGDQTSTECRDCVSVATTFLLRNCSGSNFGVVWYDQCMIQYSYDAFYGAEEESPMKYMMRSENVMDNVTGFNRVLANTVNKLIGTVAAGDKSGKKFGTLEVNFNGHQNIYVLEQCTPEITAGDCSKCLQHAIRDLKLCCYGTPRGRVLMPSCNVRYDTYLFYNQSNTPSPPLPAAVNGTGPGSGGAQN